jgi:hypothetical protein
MIWAVGVDRSAVIVLCLATAVLGIYSLSTTVFDVYVCLTKGIIGYFMLRYGYSTSAARPAAVLDGEFERTLRTGHKIADGSWLTFFSRPPTPRASCSSRWRSSRSESSARCGCAGEPRWHLARRLAMKPEIGPKPM